MYLLTTTPTFPRVPLHRSRRRPRKTGRRSGLPPLSELLAGKLLSSMLIAKPDALDIAMDRLIDRVAVEARRFSTTESNRH